MEAGEKVRIAGIKIDRIGIGQACKIAEEHIEARKNRCMVIQAINVDFVVKAHLNEEVFKIANKSDLCLADGMPIVWMSKLLKKPINERASGPDFFENFNEIANNKNYKYFFLGSQDRIVAKIINILQEKYPNIEVVGSYSPPFSEMNDVDENKSICESINSTKPDVVWVSLGCPKQERWIIQNSKYLQAGIAIGIGAAFNFYSGEIKRAPKILRNLGFEWLYRFLCEPRRLWRRYFIEGPKFFYYVFRYRNT